MRCHENITHDFPTELEEVMSRRNFHIRGKINYAISGRWQRFPDATKHHKRSKDLFVMLHDFDRGATFGDWHYPDDWYTHWNSAYGQPTVTDMVNRKKEMEQRKIEQQYERSKKQWRAKEFFSKYYCELDARKHPYVMRKKILPYYAKMIRSYLLVPVHDIDHHFITLQIIKPDGFKRLWKGTSHRDCMMWLWNKLPDDYNGVIRICEGYATGCTIRAATKSPVVCAVNAQNMINVSRLLHTKFPRACIKVCTDNDQWGKENTGLKIAEYLKQQHASMIYYPEFKELDIFSKPTDFNDLYQLNGYAEVRRQLTINKD